MEGGEIMTSHTGAKDKDYDLISVLYHSLKGADLCHTYAEDAKRDGDNELAGFFDEAREQYRSLAEKAKKFTKSKL
jgi:hypothetical protein